jgi:hypothetical protein
MKSTPQNKAFLKVEHELLDNMVLKPVEKCLLMLLRRLRTAPRGCEPSHAYLRQRLSIKDKRTLSLSLDRLQKFGYITWLNRGKGKTSKYYFNGEPNFLAIVNKNISLRLKMSKEQKELYKKRKVKRTNNVIHIIKNKG